MIAPSTQTAHRFAHIDALRTFAVMLVVVAHAGLGHVVPGGSGVTIFFSISGFIITYLLLRERDRTSGFSASGFYLRRVLKIGPPLLVAIIIPTAIYALFAHVDIWPVVAQILFVFNWVKIAGADAASGFSTLPGSGVVWSLSIEEQFYILFASFWLFAHRSRHYLRYVVGAAFAVIVASTTSRLILASDPTNTWRIYYGSDTRFDGIALGILAALLYFRWAADATWLPRARAFFSSAWAPTLAGILYLASLALRGDWFRDVIRYPMQGVAACLLILFGLLGAGRAHRTLQAVSASRVVNTIGLASYSIYLTHLSVMELLQPLISILPTYLQIAILVATSVAGGLVMWQIIEVPFEKIRAHLRDRTSAPATPQVRVD